MSVFAKLDNNNIVIETTAVSNEIATSDNLSQEQQGIDFLTEWSGGYTNWKQTSQTNSFRKNYAGAGYTYDPALDAFIPPKPFSSWFLAEETCQWQAPTPYPSDENVYTWDEVSQSWVLFS